MMIQAEPIKDAPGSLLVTYLDYETGKRRCTTLRQVDEPGFYLAIIIAYHQRNHDRLDI